MQVFRYADGALPNNAVFAYIAAGYPLSIWGLKDSAGPVSRVLSCLLLAHVLIISAYLLHECIHNTIFRRSRHNRVLGRLLSWTTGAAYTPYRVLEKKHLRHHADRVDVLAIDCHRFIDQHTVLQRLLQLLQRCHIPAVEILTHMLTVAAPFMLESRRDQRTHVMIMLASRLLFFALLAALDPLILPAYLFAWLIMLAVLGFMDTFQHLYEVRLLLEDDRVLREFDRDYEESHTFSNLLSQRFPLLNLLVLNFCYHNAHHFRSGIPWHDLPRAHADRYRDRQAPVIALHDQLRNYHRYRNVRLPGITSGNKDIGAAGVSFLVGV